MQNQLEQAPDVEAIMAEIQQGLADAEAAVPAATVSAREQEKRLQENLAAANRSCAVGQAPGGGVSGLVRRVLYRLLAPLIRDVNEHQAHSVRVLNQVVRVLGGQDEPGAAELLASARQRADLLALVSRRLAEYDRLDIEARLRRIEETLGSRGKDPA